MQGEKVSSWSKVSNMVEVNVVPGMGRRLNLGQGKIYFLLERYTATKMREERKKEWAHRYIHN